MSDFPQLKKRLIGESAAVNHLRDLIVRLAQINVSTLITGEAGTGKEIVARLLHECSPRKDEPFVTVNLAAISSGLAQSELFGHVRGAFTGASRDRHGFFEIANRGTLLLDEIDYAPLEMQAALINTIATGEIHRIGDSRSIAVDVRVIAVTRGNPEASIRAGRLREDLYYRLNVARLDIPPLREREGDVLLLAKYFLDKLNVELKRNIKLSDKAGTALIGYKFPGNIRELKNIISVAAFSCESDLIGVEDLRLPERKIKPKKIEPVVEKQQTNSLRNQIDLLRAKTIDASPIWEGRRFPMEPDYCFVLMPFSDTSDLQHVYRDHIKPVLEKRCGLRCERADDIYGISGVMQSVWEGINRARLIIADLTDRNSNVFYELGIAHTLGKPVIMLTQSMDFVPFDLRHLRCIVYRYKPSEINKLEKALERTVGTVLSSSDDSGPSQRAMWIRNE